MVSRISMSPDALGVAWRCFAVAKMRAIRLAVTPSFANELRYYAYIDPRDRFGVFYTVHRHIFVQRKQRGDRLSF